MKDIQMIYENCKEKLNDIGIQTGEIKCVTINTRAIRRWGRCKRVFHYGREMYEIEISSRLLEDFVDDKATEDTMMHELLHSCEGCMNHGTKWKQLANKVNCQYGYNIKRTTSSEEKAVDDIRPIKAKYKIICTKCGHVGYRMKACKLTKYPSHYLCSCGGKLKVEY